MVFTLVAPLLLVATLQLTRLGFTIPVAKHSGASFIWMRTSLLISGRKALKFNGLLHLNQYAGHKGIVLETPSVPLLLRMAYFDVFVMGDTIGTLMQQLVLGTRESPNGKPA